MQGHWRLWGTDHIWLARWAAAPVGESHERLSAMSAMELLRHGFPDHGPEHADGLGVVTLGEIVEQLDGPLPSMVSSGIAALRDRIGLALSDGTLVAYRARPLVALELPTAQTEDTPEPARRLPTAWIAIRLVDADDPSVPVAAQRYCIKLPDGSVAEGRTGRDGTARVERLDPGTCMISFPDIDPEDWQPL